ncbi:MAG: TlpA disulfide reductase family protein [Sedimenticola sp.]
MFIYKKQIHERWIKLLPLLLLLFTLPSAAQQSLMPVDDQPIAPPFSLLEMSGEKIDLSSYRGKVLVVNFWATWCGPCREEMPSLGRAAKWLERFNGQLISINTGEKRERVARYLDKAPVTFPVLLDQNAATAADWGVYSYPTTFVIDPEGRISYLAMGRREWDDPMLLVPIRALGM